MKAVIQVGGKQQIVAEKETLLVDKLPEETKDLTFDALLTFDDQNLQLFDQFVAQTVQHGNAGGACFA